MTTNNSNIMTDREHKSVKWLVPTLLGLGFILFGSIITIAWDLSPKVNQIDSNERSINRLYDYVKYNEEGVRIAFEYIEKSHPEIEDPQEKLWQYESRKMVLRGGE